MTTESESNIRSLDDFRRKRRERHPGESSLAELEIELGRLEDVARFLLRKDDHWGEVVAQMQRDITYLLDRK